MSSTTMLLVASLQNATVSEIRNNSHTAGLTHSTVAVKTFGRCVGSAPCHPSWIPTPSGYRSKAKKIGYSHPRQPQVKALMGRGSADVSVLNKQVNNKAGIIGQFKSRMGSRHIARQQSTQGMYERVTVKSRNGRNGKKGIKRELEYQVSDYNLRPRMKRGTSALPRDEASTGLSRTRQHRQQMPAFKQQTEAGELRVEQGITAKKQRAVQSVASPQSYKSLESNLEKKASPVSELVAELPIDGDQESETMGVGVDGFAGDVHKPKRCSFRSAAPPGQKALVIAPDVNKSGQKVSPINRWGDFVSNPDDWDKKEINLRFNQGEVAFERALFTPNDKLKDILTSHFMTKAAGRLLLKCAGGKKNKMCKVVSLLKTEKVMERLGLDASSVKIMVDKNPASALQVASENASEKKGRLILIRDNSDHPVASNPVIVVDVGMDRDITSAHFTVYKKGILPLIQALPSLDVTTAESVTLAPGELPTIHVAPKYCRHDYVATAKTCGWDEGESVVEFHRSGNVTFDSRMYSANDQVKEMLCQDYMLNAAGQLLLACGDEQYGQCSRIKTGKSTVISQQLGLTNSAVSIAVQDDTVIFPPRNPLNNSRLLLSRQDSDQTGNKAAIVVFVDNDVSSVNFTIYKKGVVSPLPAPKLRIPDPELPGGVIHNTKVVFISGEDKREGYRQFRLPAVQVIDDVVLLCSEGRRSSTNDPGDNDGGIDIVCKRNVNGTLEFGRLEMLVSGTDGYRGTSAYQPTLVTDTSECYQRFYLFYNRAQMRPFYIYSDDLARSWSAEVDLRANMENWPRNNKKLSVNTGSGIQLEDGKLVIPMNTILTGDPLGKVRPSVGFSANHGRYWEYGGHAEPGANEHQVVEVFNGGKSRLVSSSRRDGNGAAGINTRRINYGAFNEVIRQWEWGKASTPVDARNHPIWAYPISAGFERYTIKGVNGATANRVLLTLPDDTSRNNLCVYVSTDEGRKYGQSKILYSATGVGYSDIVTVDGDLFLTVWERAIFERSIDTFKLTIANRRFLEDDSVPECN